MFASRSSMKQRHGQWPIVRKQARYRKLVLVSPRHGLRLVRRQLNQQQDLKTVPLRVQKHALQPDLKPDHNPHLKRIPQPGLKQDQRLSRKPDLLLGLKQDRQQDQRHSLKLDPHQGPRLDPHQGPKAAQLRAPNRVRSSRAQTIASRNGNTK